MGAKTVKKRLFGSFLLNIWHLLQKVELTKSPFVGSMLAPLLRGACSKHHQQIRLSWKVPNSRCLHNCLFTSFKEIKIVSLDVETSRKALEFANGYIMKGKPIVICYGKDAKG